MRASSQAKMCAAILAKKASGPQEKMDREVKSIIIQGNTLGVVDVDEEGTGLDLGISAEDIGIKAGEEGGLIPKIIGKVLFPLGILRRARAASSSHNNAIRSINADYCDCMQGLANELENKGSACISTFIEQGWAGSAASLATSMVAYNQVMEEDRSETSSSVGPGGNGPGGIRIRPLDERPVHYGSAIGVGPR